MKQLPTLKAAATLDPKELARIEELESAASKHRQEVERAKSVASKVEVQVKELQDQIFNAGGVKLKVQKSKVAGIEEEISCLERGVTQAQVKIKSKKKSITNSQVWPCQFTVC